MDQDYEAVRDELPVKVHTILTDQRKGERRAADLVIRTLDFEETDIILTWAQQVSAKRPLSAEEHVLRRLIYAQHCLLFMEKEQERERARQANAERIAGGLRPICQCRSPKVKVRNEDGAEAGTEGIANRYYCVSCGESLG